MPSPRNLGTRLVIIGVVAAAGAAWAQNAPADPPASKPAASPANDPLAGPKVAEAPKKAGIVQRDFDGKVVLPEGSPEEAAVRVLGLDGDYATPEQKAAWAKVQEVLNKRHRILDDFVVEHLNLLVELQNVKGTGNKMDQLALFQKAYQELAPLREGGSLQEQIDKVLPEADAKAFDGYLADFWKAVEADRGSMTNDDGTTPGKWGARAQTNLKMMGQEIKASYERVKDSGELLYRRLTEGLKLNATQQAAMREAAAEFMKNLEAGGEKSENRKLFFAALRSLDEEQRPTFIKNAKRLAKM